MKIDVYSSTGSKKGTLDLPESLFGARVNMDLMHQAVVMQQSNRRSPIAHAKNRSEVRGSTKKIFAQKGTGRARRGPARSPVLKGGGKAFGPKKDRNFHKDMPKSMRHAAIRSCLSHQAKNGAIFGLESYPETVKTKVFHDLLKKLPVQIGRRLLFVVPDGHKSMWMSSRNVPRVKLVRAAYLNPEDVLLARSIIFVANAVEKAETVFGERAERATTAKKTTKKKSSPSSSPSQPS